MVTVTLAWPPAGTDTVVLLKLAVACTVTIFCRQFTAAITTLMSKAH